MTTVPFALQKPIGVNQGPAMRSHLGLVLHVQVGDGSLWQYFSNPATQASAHFWVSKAGVLEQFIDTAAQAWAQVRGNPDYLSVETEGYPNEALTDAQIATLGRLLAWCHETYSVPLVHVDHGGSGFTQHCFSNGQPDPAWGNHSCPEALRMSQIPAIIAAAGPAPVPPPSGSPQEDDVKVIWERPNGAQYLELPSGKLVHVDPATSSSLTANGWVIVGVSDVVANEAGMT